ncbi:Ig-like domain-containing protein [Domibacillus sp. A3M-37]|uniref:Ig-like domain-containing protein n=1 Tax=Domibacillus sp. A3M-37 TaxID=2962037 RepID=UPI0020B88A8D|nr:Ig-like domain-containing protein [Domibacillus sp. A3M-37]MCP3762670.1 Ig-like domain-containing protein [Domibacillus sp. A3M-37]
MKKLVSISLSLFLLLPNVAFAQDNTSSTPNTLVVEGAEAQKNKNVPEPSSVEEKMVSALTDETGSEGNEAQNLTGTISFSDSQTISEYSTSVNVINKTTDEYIGINVRTDGTFSASLTEGTYEVYAIYHWDGEDSKTFYSTQTFTISNEATVPFSLNINIFVDNIKGKVFEEGTNKLFVNGWINVKNKEGSRYYDLRVDSKGEFVDTLPAGIYIINYMDFEGNEDLDVNTINYEFEIKDNQENILDIKIPSPSFKGKVIFKNGRILTSDEELYLQIENTNNNTFSTTKILEDGTFSKKLNPGNYKIRELTIQNKETYDWESFGLNEKIEILENEVTTKDIIINEYNVSGNVKESETLNHINSGQISIMSVSDDGESDYFRAVIHEDGTFKTTVPNGKYRITDIRLEDDSYIELNQEFEVNDNKVEDLHVTIPPVSFIGQLKFADNKVDFENSSVSLTIKGNNDYFYVQPDKEGLFNLRLPKGNYILQSVRVYDYETHKNKTYYVNESFEINGDKTPKELIIKSDNFSGKLAVGNSSSYNLGEGYMRIKDVESDEHYSVTIDEEGNFSGRLPKGKYQVYDLDIYDVDLKFINKTEFEITDENGNTSIDVSVPALALEGEVVLPDEITNTDIEYAALTVSKGNTSETIRLDSEGKFSVHMPAGEYKIESATFDLSTNKRITYSLDESVSISANQTSPVFKTITLQTLNLKGNVAEEGTLNKLGSGSIDIRNKNTRDYYTLEFSEDGSFSAFLLKGNYVIERVNFWEHDNHESVQLNQEFTIIDENETTSLEVRIPAENVNGQIQFENGFDLADLANYDYSYLSLKDDEDNYVYLSVNKDGTFNGRLVPGTYEFIQLSIQKNESDERLSFPLDQEFSIKKGEKKSVTVTVEKNNVTGSLSDEGGKPYSLGSGELELHSDDDRYYSIQVDESGKFQTRLPVGEYRVISLDTEKERVLLNSTIEVTDASKDMSLNIVVPKVNFTGTVQFKGEMDFLKVDVMVTLAQEVGVRHHYHRNLKVEDGKFSARLAQNNYSIYSVVVRNKTTGAEEEFKVNKDFIMSNEPINETIVVEEANVKGKVSVKNSSENIGYGSIIVYKMNSQDKDNKYYFFDEFNFNEKGEFSFYLKPGEYKITGISAHDLNEYVNIFDKEFTVGAEPLDLDVVIPPVTVTGKVELSDPKMLEKILETYESFDLHIQNKKSQMWIVVPIERNGSFKIRLPIGNYDFYGISAYPYDDSLESLFVPLDDSIEIKNESMAIEKNIKVDVDVPSPTTLHIDSVNDSSTAVTGSTDPKMTIEISNQSKMIGTGKSNSDGEFSVKIPKQKLGTVLTVVVKDADGNETEKMEVNVQDGTPPEAPVVYPVSDQSDTVTGKTEAGAAVTVKAETGTEMGSGTADDEGNFSIEIAKQKAGTTIYVTAEDAAGNVSKETKVVVADGTAPEAPVVDPVKELQKAVTGTTEPGMTVTVTHNEKVLKSGKSDKTGKFSLSVKMPAKGSILLVTVKDEDGNESEAAKVTVLDGVAPSAPTVDAVNDQSDTVTGKVEADAAITIKAETGTEMGSGMADDEGNFSIKIAKQKAGTSIYVTAEDEAGNASKETKVMVSDGTAPEAPVVDPVKELQKAVTGTTEPGMTVTIMHDDKILKTGKSDKNGKFSLSVKIPAKESVLLVTVKDAAGNESDSTEATVLDGIAPSAPTVNPVNDQSDTVTGKTEAYAAVTVKVGTEPYTGEANEQGVFNVDIINPKAGTSILVTAEDEAGNASKETKVMVSDGTAPEAPVVDPVKELQKAVTGTTEPGMTVTIMHDDKILKTGKSDKNGKFSLSVKIPAKESVLLVTVKDAAGNESDSTEVTVLDGIAPSAPTVNPVNDQSDTVTGKTEAYAAVTVKVGTEPYTGEANEQGVFNVDIINPKAGTSILVTAADQAENVSKETKVVVSDVTPPDAPEVDDITSKQKTVTGKTEPQVTVTIKNAAGKVLKSGKSNKNGEFKLSISAQPAGTKLYITATDSAKYTSEVTVKEVQP